MAFFLYVLCLIGAGLFLYGVVHWLTRGSKE